MNSLCRVRLARVQQKIEKQEQLAEGWKLNIRLLRGEPKSRSNCVPSISLYLGGSFLAGIGQTARFWHHLSRVENQVPRANSADAIFRSDVLPNSWRSLFAVLQDGPHLKNAALFYWGRMRSNRSWVARSRYCGPPNRAIRSAAWMVSPWMISGATCNRWICPIM